MKFCESMKGAVRLEKGAELLELRKEVDRPGGLQVSTH